MKSILFKKISAVTFAVALAVFTTQTFAAQLDGDEMKKWNAVKKKVIESNPALKDEYDKLKDMTDTKARFAARNKIDEKVRELMIKADPAIKPLAEKRLSK